MGALVVGGSAFSRPGRKKLAGETLCVVFTPLQPPLKKNNGTSIASQTKFQLNLTCQV
jgi:hypothetical protein